MTTLINFLVKPRIKTMNYVRVENSNFDWEHQWHWDPSYNPNIDFLYEYGLSILSIFNTFAKRFFGGRFMINRRYFDPLTKMWLYDRANLEWVSNKNWRRIATEKAMVDRLHEARTN